MTQKKTKQNIGQASIEITFSVIVVVMLMLSMVRVFYWVSNDLSARRQAHEQTLTNMVNSSAVDDNYRQIRPVYYEGTPIDAATISSDIFGVNRL